MGMGVSRLRPVSWLMHLQSLEEVDKEILLNVPRGGKSHGIEPACMKPATGRNKNNRDTN